MFVEFVKSLFLYITGQDPFRLEVK